MMVEGRIARRHTLSWPVFLVLAGVALTVLFTLLRPEATRSLGLAERFVFWACTVGGLLCLMQIMQLLILRAGLDSLLPHSLQIVLAGVVGALAFAPVGAWLDQAFGASNMIEDQGQVILDEFGALVAPAVLTWVGLNAVRILMLGSATDIVRSKPPTSNSEEEPDKPPFDQLGDSPLIATAGPIPAFWSRVRASLGQDIVALSAELHYLRVETAAGNALILYPFGLAVAELDAAGVDGLQIHRSHWVAHAHVVTLVRANGQASCLLDTGTRLPVGRRRLSDVMARLPTSVRAQTSTLS